MLTHCFLPQTLAQIPADGPYVAVVDGGHLPRSSKRMPGLSWEWLKLRTFEIADVAGVAGEGARVQLAAVPGRDEELDRAPQGRERARGAAGAAPQAREIVVHLGVVDLDAIRLALARRDGVCARRVDQCLIGREGVGGVLLL